MGLSIAPRIRVNICNSLVEYVCVKVQSNYFLQATNAVTKMNDKSRIYFLIRT